MYYCSKCDNKLSNEAIYCSKCGEKIGENKRYVDECQHCGGSGKCDCEICNRVNGITTPNWLDWDCHNCLGHGYRNDEISRKSNEKYDDARERGYFDTYYT